MSKLLVTGASGLLGINLALMAAERGYEVTGWTNQNGLRSAPFATQSVDLLKFDQITPRLDEFEPDLIIHCAAMANLELAAKEPKMAHELNGVVPGILATEAKRLNAKFIHISTDAVFDGFRGDYAETDRPNPQNAYAYSKLEGEKAVYTANPEAIVARVVFYGWSLGGQRSLSEFFYSHLLAEQPVKGYTDMFFTPLYVGHLADILLQMGDTNLNGTWHVFGSESLSKYAFGVSLAQEFGLDETLVSPVLTPEGDDRVRRSLRLTMKTDKLASALGKDMPTIQEGLSALHADVENGLRDRIRSMNERNEALGWN